MFGYAFSPWWILFPVIMLVFCVLMMLMMRGRMGCMGGMMGGHDKHDSEGTRESGSAMEILDKRYALGEINKEEYEDKKKALSRQI